MIKVLVIDDDFRVAQIHADRVGRVAGRLGGDLEAKHLV